MIFTKTREVIAPEQAMGDAGIDFFVPVEFKTCKLYPGESVLIPSGIKVVVPENHVLIAFNKSGIATKKGLIVGACVVDSGYRGEVHIHLINTNKHKVVNIYPNDKAVQFVLLPYVHGYVKEISNTIYNVQHDNTPRGSGGFGSTNKE